MANKENTVDHVIIDIPPPDLTKVVDDFESVGCTVVPTEQADKNWTIVATCPLL